MAEDVIHVGIHPCLPCIHPPCAPCCGRAPDVRRFPKFREARGCRARVADGDALFIPIKWWHYCENETGCIAVNDWWL